MVGTHQMIVMAAMIVKPNAVSAQDLLILNVKHVTITISLIHLQPAMKHAQIDNLEILTTGYVRIAPLDALTVIP